MARPPRGKYIVHTLLSLEVATPKHECNSLKLSSTCKSASSEVLGRIAHPSFDSPNHLRRFALGASNMPVRMVKTRRALSRHCRNTRVYGHTTTAKHDVEYTLPLPTPAEEGGHQRPKRSRHRFMPHSKRGSTLLLSAVIAVIDREKTLKILQKICYYRNVW